METNITFNDNTNWGITNIFYGFATEDIDLIEAKVRNKLLKIGEENSYSKINIHKIDFTLNGWVKVVYTFLIIPKFKQLTL